MIDAVYFRAERKVKRTAGQLMHSVAYTCCFESDTCRAPFVQQLLIRLDYFDSFAHLPLFPDLFGRLKLQSATLR